MSSLFRLQSGAAVLCLALGLGCAISPAGAYTLEQGVGDDFFGNDFNWLMDPSLIIDGATRDPQALLEIARLMKEGDARTGLALQNYITRYPRDAAAFDLAGVSLMQQGDGAKARMAFEKGLVLQPKDTWLRAKLGAVLVMTQQPELGRGELEQVISEDPDNPLALRNLAYLAVQDGDLPTAIRYSERALRVFGMPAGTVNQAHFDLAELYLQAGRHLAALDLLRPAVENPDLDIPEDAVVQLYGRFLDAAMSVGAVDDASMTFDKLLPLVEASNPMVQLTQARLLRMQGDFNGSLGLLDKLMQGDAGFGHQLLPDRAITFASAGQHDAAAQVWMDIAQDAHAGEEIPFYEQAFTQLIAAGTGDRALSTAEGLVEQAPDREDLRLLEIEFLGKAGQPAKALKRATRMTEDFPKSAEAFRMKGILASAQGDTAGGAEALERSLAIEPAQPKVWLTLAGVVHGHGSYVGAGHDAAEGNASHGDVEALLSRAIKANPNDADLAAELGLMYLSDGKLPEAISQFDAAVTHNPAHMAGLSLGALARADAEVELGAALAMVDRARAMVPEEAINKDIMGWVLVRQGALDAGLKLLDDAVEQAPDDVTIQYHLGVAHQDKGNEDAARTHLLASLSGPNYTHNVTDARERYVQMTPADQVTLQLSRIDEGHVGDPVGTITLAGREAGLDVSSALSGLQPGSTRRIFTNTPIAAQVRTVRDLWQVAIMATGRITTCQTMLCRTTLLWVMRWICSPKPICLPATCRRSRSVRMGHRPRPLDMSA